MDFCVISGTATSLFFLLPHSFLNSLRTHFNCSAMNEPNLDCCLWEFSSSKGVLSHLQMHLLYWFELRCVEWTCFTAHCSCFVDYKKKPPLWKSTVFGATTPLQNKVLFFCFFFPVFVVFPTLLYVTFLLLWHNDNKHLHFVCVWVFLFIFTGWRNIRISVCVPTD